MAKVTDRLYMIVFVAVLAGWCAFAAAFLLRKRPRKAIERRSVGSSSIGIVLVGVGYVLVWTFRGPLCSPILPLPPVLQIAIDCLTVVMAVVALWFIMSAIRILGKQWSPTAKIVEGHRLVTDGPYRIVRHPIYLGMFGMMVVTGLAISYWYVLVPAIVFANAGTAIRVHFEEKLLRQAFGDEFDEYRGSVAAFIPYIY